MFSHLRQVFDITCELARGEASRVSLDGRRTISRTLTASGARRSLSWWTDGLQAGWAFARTPVWVINGSIHIAPR